MSKISVGVFTLTGRMVRPAKPQSPMKPLLFATLITALASPARAESWADAPTLLSLRGTWVSPAEPGKPPDLAPDPCRRAMTPEQHIPHHLFTNILGG